MQKQYTYEELHDLFHDYLMEKFGGNEAKANSVIEKAEGEVTQVLVSFFHSDIQFIYELTDEETIASYVKMIKLHPIVKNNDIYSDPRYTEVLKWYRLFIKHLSADNKPVMVPGEADGTKVADDRMHQPVVRKTVFVEGEAEESQPREIRIRNHELRQACIDHFKALHGGHLVCECCGFDFTIAYGISDEYIEVHHRTPFHETEGAHEVNAETDLVPLCANCHRMIHHLMPGKGTCISLDELKANYRGKNYFDEE